MNIRSGGRPAATRRDERLANLEHTQRPGRSGRARCSRFARSGRIAAAPFGMTLGLGFLLLLAAPVAAQIPVYEGDDVRLQLSGYARTLTGLHDPDIDQAGAPVKTGFGSGVVRLKWRLGLGDAAVLDAHQRVFSHTAPGGSGLAAGGLGLGVSAIPGRSVDLETVLVDESGLSVRHDIDRLALTLYTDAADITIGRQAVTWGLSSFFPVADLSTTFSPFELDTQEKPGSDAVRVLAYPVEGLELDALVADRGAVGGWSAGLRATRTMPFGDAFVFGGKFWNEAIAGGGATWLLDRVKLRAEAVFPRDLDEDAFLRPRATVGVDYVASSLALTGEYHYNGGGAEHPAGYLARLSDPVVRRGESYYLGRHYLGALVGYTRLDPLSLDLSVIANLGDGSVIVTPMLRYDVGSSARVTAGAFRTFGDRPLIGAGPVPGLRSEYGADGHLFFVQLGVYF